MRVPRAPAQKLRSIFRLDVRLPTAPGLPIAESGDFDTSPFSGSSRASHCLRVPVHLGYRISKYNGACRIYFAVEYARCGCGRAENDREGDCGASMMTVGQSARVFTLILETRDEALREARVLIDIGYEVGSLAISIGQSEAKQSWPT